jgi:hypothetical protein
MKYLALLSLVGVIGCGGDPAALDVDATNLPVDLSVEMVHYDQPRVGDVVGGRSEIEVRYSFLVYNAGYEFRAALDRRPSGRYRLEVIAEFKQGVWPVLTHYQYQAVVRELPPGRYPLTVVHLAPSEGKDTTVFVGDVHVR